MNMVKDIGSVSTAVMAVAALLGGIWWIIRKLVKIAEAVKQLHPNGGSSLADKVNKISAKQDEMTVNIGNLTTEVEKLKVFDEEVSEALKERKRKRW